MGAGVVRGPGAPGTGWRDERAPRWPPRAQPYSGVPGTPRSPPREGQTPRHGLLAGAAAPKEVTSLNPPTGRCRGPVSRQGHGAESPGTTGLLPGAAFLPQLRAHTVPTSGQEMPGSLSGQGTEVPSGTGDRRTSSPLQEGS